MAWHWLLTVNAPHFSSFCIWRAEKTPNGPKWTCVDADPFSAWMKGKDVAEVGAYLKKRKYEYIWTVEDTPDIEAKASNAEEVWLKKVNRSSLDGTEKFRIRT